MSLPREASWYERLPDGRVHCLLCPHDCRVPDRSRGACAVRYNDGGSLYTLVYDAIIGARVEPIEKKPLFHFMPGSTAYSFGTVGCNLQCGYCQNWQLSQWPRTALPRRLEANGHDTNASTPAPGACLERLADMIPGRRVTPREIVDAALTAGASSIAYTFTEPTVFFELVHDTATLARAAGLRNVLVTSAFISERPLAQLARVVDAVNVDLKFFDQHSYRRISRAALRPVLDAIRAFHDLGVWVEITTLVIPDLNDTPSELRRIAQFIRSIGSEVPWHVSRFYPAYKMADRPVTPVETLRLARRVGDESGLRYVYEGNVPGASAESTACPSCGTAVVERRGHAVTSNRIRDGRCPACETWIDGISMGGSAQSLGRA